MIKSLFLFVLAFSLAFSVVGAECTQILERCIQNACIHANGELNENGVCLASPEFDADVYEEDLATCNYTFEYCIENDGLVHNMSCFGPVFILLGLLTLAVKYST